MIKKLILLAVLIGTTFAPVLHAEDYALKTCIVSGDKLGGDLGPVVETNYKGRVIKLCCKSCIKTFNKNPEKYLKILDAAEKK